MINKYYPPHIGGIECHVRCLAEGLAKLEGITVRVVVAGNGRHTLIDNVSGVDVIRLPRWGEFSSMPVASGMVQALRAQCSDGVNQVFHLHFPYPWGEISWLLARKDTRTVLTYHADIVRQKTALWIYKPVLRYVLRKVDAIIATSPNMLQHSAFLPQVGHKCRVIPFGIDVDRFAATPEIAARAAELRSSHARPIVLFVGRLVYYKGVDVLLQAMRNVNADLVIIGKGPLEPALRRLALESGVQGRTTFLDHQPFQELVAWYHAADLLCLPSTARSEGFGLVQLEAQASGTPVISTDLTTGVPFANQHGRTGLVVPAGDAASLERALSTLLDDRSLKSEFSARGMKRVRDEFTMKRMISETRAVYDEIVG